MISKLRIAAWCSLLCFFVACTKETQESPVTDYMLVTKITNQFTDSTGRVHVNSTTYEYNQKGQLIRRRFDGDYFEYTYNGELPINEKYYSAGRLVGDRSNFMYITPDGDSVFYSKNLFHPPRLEDTIYYYFKFKGTQIQSERVYIHFKEEEAKYENFTYKYDSSGNLTEYESIQDGLFGKFLLIGYDEKKTPLSNMPRINRILMGFGGYHHKGNSNPLKVRDSIWDIEFDHIYTYNSEGYPTMITTKQNPEAITFFEYNR